MYQSYLPVRPLRLRALIAIPLLLAGLAVSTLAGCDGAGKAGSSGKAGADEHAGHDHGPGEEQNHDHDHTADEDPTDVVTPGNIPIPAQVRQNLGITFAKVEMRRVASTLRVPGRFEIRPSAVRQYHAPLAGRVELLVNQYDHVTTGTPLYRLDSGEWRRMQQEFLSLKAEVLATSATLATAQVAREGGEAATDIIRLRVSASDAHIQTLTQSIKVAEDRERQIARLHEVVGGRLTELNEARSQLATLRNELSQAREDRAELEHEHLQLSTGGTGSAYGTTETRQASLVARQAEYESAKARLDLIHASLLSMMGEAGATSSDSTSDWTVVPDVVIRAATEGTVSKVAATSGAYVDTSAEILTTVNSSALRFRAVALQSDIARLAPEMDGRITAPASSANVGSIAVTVSLGLEADHEERTLDLVADVDASLPWARPGVSTDLELVLDDTEDAEPAIPVAAVIQDGLEKVFFRRNPDKPNEAMRVKADLGVSDGKWVQLYSGAKSGDEVVLHGVYELKLATADAPAKAGHFHADGTFHEEDH